MVVRGAGEVGEVEAAAGGVVAGRGVERVEAGMEEAMAVAETEVEAMANAQPQRRAAPARAGCATPHEAAKSQIGPLPRQLRRKQT